MPNLIARSRAYCLEQAQAMRDAVARMLAFCMKEVREIIQQPLLVISLLFGPTLILLLFGLGYQNSQPSLRTLLVLPANPSPNYPVADIRQAVAASFNVVDVVNSRAQALAQLHAGQVQ